MTERSSCSTWSAGEGWQWRFRPICAALIAVSLGAGKNHGREPARNGLEGCILVHTTTAQSIGTATCRSTNALHVSQDNGLTFSQRSILPFDVQGPATGPWLLCGLSPMLNDEKHLDYATSDDSGCTWSAVQTAFMAKKIRNPQMAAFKDAFVLHGAVATKARGGITSSSIPRMMEWLGHRPLMGEAGVRLLQQPDRQEPAHSRGERKRLRGTHDNVLRCDSEVGAALIRRANLVHRKALRKDHRVPLLDGDLQEGTHRPKCQDGR